MQAASGDPAMASSESTQAGGSRSASESSSGASSSKCIVLVDETNIYIGGAQLAAEQKGVRRAHGRHIPEDPSWHIDFDGLIGCLAKGRQVFAAIVVGSAVNIEKAFWTASARAAGFRVIVHERKPHRGEKEVDTELVARGAEIIASTSERMTLVLAAGDSDYVPLVELAHRHGWDAELRAFRSSYPRHGALVDAVDRVESLDDCLQKVGEYAYRWPGEPAARDRRPGESRPGESRPGESRPGESRPGESRPGESGDQSREFVPAQHHRQHSRQASHGHNQVGSGRRQRSTGSSKRHPHCDREHRAKID